MPNEDLYTFISYGKRKGNKITYTRSLNLRKLLL